MLNPLQPADAQAIVTAYLRVAEAHAADDIYPGALRDLPYPKDAIRTAFKTVTTTLVGAGQFPADLRDYFEIAYVSLADYVQDEAATLLREYANAGKELTETEGLPRDRVHTDAWRRVSEQSRLAGETARAISAEGDELRTEFRAWQSALSHA
jgi:hypothetical protein